MTFDRSRAFSGPGQIGHSSPVMESMFPANEVSPFGMRMTIEHMFKNLALIWAECSLSTSSAKTR
jgi:hypothetical protein